MASHALIWYDALVRNISAWYDPLHRIFLPCNSRGDVEGSDEEEEEKRGPRFGKFDNALRSLSLQKRFAYYNREGLCVGGGGARLFGVDR